MFVLLPPKAAALSEGFSAAIPLNTAYLSAGESGLVPGSGISKEGTLKTKEIKAKFLNLSVRNLHFQVLFKGASYYDYTIQFLNLSLCLNECLIQPLMTSDG